MAYHHRSSQRKSTAKHADRIRLGSGRETMRNAPKSKF